MKSSLGGGAHEVPDTQVVVEFDNPTPEPCHVDQYQIEWGGRRSSLNLTAGSQRCKPTSSTLLPHGHGQDTCTIVGRDGPGNGFNQDTARVLDVRGSCVAVR